MKKQTLLCLLLAAAMLLGLTACGGNQPAGSGAVNTGDAASPDGGEPSTLVYASGAAENHTTFTEEDIQLAAEGIVDGTYQLVDLTHPEGFLWIRVTAGDKMDARCTVEATKPEGAELGFYMAKMPPKEAAAWLTDYPRLLPEGRDWKKIKKPK